MQLLRFFDDLEREDLQDARKFLRPGVEDMITRYGIATTREALRTIYHEVKMTIALGKDDTGVGGESANDIERRSTATKE